MPVIIEFYGASSRGGCYLLHRGHYRISLACASDQRRTKFIPPRCRIEGRFLAGLTFLPSLQAAGSEVIE
jgi:hypothetical protein